MTGYTYRTIPMSVHYKLRDDGKAGDVEIDALTPKEQCEIGARIMAELDKSILLILSGGQVNHVGSGTTIDHVPRKKLLTNQRGDR